MSILKNVVRNGNITSSEIVALTTKGTAKGSFGKPFYTYVDECNMERRLGRSISSESNARPLSWGKLVERQVEKTLPMSYALTSDDTFRHHTIECWYGSPDATKEDEEIGRTVGDIKSPQTLKSFCQLVDPIYEGLEGMDAINALRYGYKDKRGYQHDKHKDGEKYYWQLVSNGIITNSKFAELIVYVPYESELEQIRSLAARSEERKYNWILMADDMELPSLPDNGYYKNLNTIRFQIPEFDKKFLTDCVLEAEKLLIPFPDVRLIQSA